MSELPPLRRGDVVLAVPGPLGGEIRKPRPWVIVSPNDLNDDRTTFVGAPLTTGMHPYRFRVACQFRGRAGNIILDQVTTIAIVRVQKHLGKLPAPVMQRVLANLREMFAD